MKMEHEERRDWVAEVARIVRTMNETERDR
jgi:hypothetical protein